MKAFIKFLSEARTELLKVSWPTRNVAISLTITVLLVSVAFAVYIAGVDYLMTQGVKWITARSTQTNSQTVPTNSTPIEIGDVQTSPAN